MTGVVSGCENLKSLEELIWLGKYGCGVPTVGIEPT